MNKEELDFKKFVEEIERTKDLPCNKPYSLEDYVNDRNTIEILREIDLNRNHSWIKELWIRNKSRLDYIAIKYRGKKFTYKEFFIKSYEYAKALKKNGLKKGEEFVCCIENTPEFPFIMGAASLIGARVNLVSADMDEDYLKEIINKAESSFVFVSDMSFSRLVPTLKKINSTKKIIPIPIDYSLKNGNPYKEIIDKYYKLDSDKYNKDIKSLSNIFYIDEFLKSGEDYFDDVIEQTGLNDAYTTTYTSGSTSSNKPKGLVHRVRSYITMGRYHDKEVSGIPTMEKRTTLALVKTMSDTDFMSNISDTFMQGGTVALEPINDKNFFLISLLINKPTLAITSISVWIHVMKQQMNNKEFENIKLPFLLVPTSVGEPMSANEEKAVNKWLRKMKAGTDITKVPVTCMSLAGGDSEHGGIFLSLFRSLQSKKYKLFGLKEAVGMKTYDMVIVKALRPDGTYCDAMEKGQLVANSPCTMEGYVDNPKADSEFFIKDAYGKQWANLNTYGYIDKFNHIYVRSRIHKDDQMIPNYIVADAILKDTKKIMSCEVVNVNFNGEKVYVAHIEPQIGVKFNVDKVLIGALERCKKIFGEKFLNSLYFRIRTNEESFPMSFTCKRSFSSLIKEGITEKCVSAKEVENKKENNNNKVLVKRKKI